MYIKIIICKIPQEIGYVTSAHQCVNTLLSPFIEMKKIIWEYCDINVSGYELFINTIKKEEVFNMQKKIKKR